jgi:membrane protease YdiL (CAAX protease family)
MVVPTWFVAVLIPMIASQIVRLHQHDAGSWIFWDYAGRLGGLAVLVAIPSARAVAFQWSKRRMPLWKIALWILGVVLFDVFLGRWMSSIVNAAFPATVLGAYFRPSGWLYFVDLVFGMALVAGSEEIVFRRCARDAFQPCLGNGYASVVATSLLFGCYHWWAGLGTIVVATMIGILLMLFLQRSDALWPVALAHYLIDFIDFA